MQWAETLGYHLRVNDADLRRLRLIPSGTLSRGAVSRMMRQVGHSYVAAFNRRHRRTGTLWEGRFKSCLIDSEQYLLTVYRYIELNPVRAAMVDNPQAYKWSSVHANLGLKHDPLISVHDVFQGMAADPRQRSEAYLCWLRAGVGDDELQNIREYMQQERALGSPAFQAMVEKTLGRLASTSRLLRNASIG